MLLFLAGVDLPTLGLIVLLLFIVGQLIFWIARKLFRKILKEWSDGQIKLLSRVIAFILSPTIIIGSLALFIYLTIQRIPGQSDEEIARQYYDTIEEDIKGDLRVGMSKAEVVGLFGATDTTQSVLIYDLSLPEAKEKYLLEIKFDTNGLQGFKRQR
ncbi:MAG TPA: hypothetical protein VF141_18570 [Chryseolinea sp.]